MAAKKKTASASDGLLDAALKLSPKEKVQLSFDPLIAKNACKRGLAVIDDHEKVLKAKHPGFDLAELRALPELCDRTQAARRAAVQARKPGGDVGELLASALSWRRRLMGLAQSLAEKGGAIDPRELRRIEAGKGATDNVQDVLDLLALLAPVEAVVRAAHGQTALADARAAASAAIEGLGGSVAETKESRSAVDLRDRYASLVVARHDRLRAAVAAVAGYRAAAALVPPLYDPSAAPKADEPKEG